MITTPTATIGVRGGIVLVDLTGGVLRVILIAGEYACVSSGGQRHCASRPGAILTEAGYQGVATAEVLANLLRILDGLFSPDADSAFFATRGTGGDDVGAFNRPDLSTIGEERDIVIFEDLPEEDMFDGRAFGLSAVPGFHDPYDYYQGSF